MRCSIANRRNPHRRSACSTRNTLSGSIALGLNSSLPPISVSRLSESLARRRHQVASHAALKYPLFSALRAPRLRSTCTPAYCNHYMGRWRSVQLTYSSSRHRSSARSRLKFHVEHRLQHFSTVALLNAPRQARHEDPANAIANGLQLLSSRVGHSLRATHSVKRRPEQTNTCVIEARCVKELDVAFHVQLDVSRETQRAYKVVRESNRRRVISMSRMRAASRI